MDERTKMIAKKIKKDVELILDESNPEITSYGGNGIVIDCDSLSDHINDLMNDVAVVLIEEILGEIER
ncbi:hypothetical protein [Enterococcus olivae]